MFITHYKHPIHIHKLHLLRHDRHVNGQSRRRFWRNGPRRPRRSVRDCCYRYGDDNPKPRIGLYKKMGPRPWKMNLFDFTFRVAYLATTDLSLPKVKSNAD